MNSYSSQKFLQDSLIDIDIFYGVKKEIRKFLIIGYHKVGKTSLATKFLLDFFPENEMKLEDDLCKIIE